MRIKTTGLGAALGTIALVATFTLAGGTSANAATTVHATSASCWADVTTGQSLCVKKGVDLISAVERATGRTIALQRGLKIGGATVSKARVAASALVVNATVQSSSIVSAVYDDVSYGGGTFLMTSDGAGCDWGIGNLGSYGWNDRVSSFKSYSGCLTALFKNNSFGGTKIGYSSAKSSLGTMNDQASSWATE